MARPDAGFGGGGSEATALAALNPACGLTGGWPWKNGLTWGLGSSFVLMSQPRWGTAGVLVQNVWSLHGAAKRDPIHQMQLVAMFSRNLAHEWYLTTNPTLSADWRQVTGERWLVPLGGGAGKTFKLGRQPVDANVALYRNVIRPASQLSPKWQLCVQVSLLFTRRQ